MTPEEFATLLALGYERGGTEFKGVGALTDSHLVAKVVRAMLGMANRRDGGLVILGVGDRNGQLVADGLSDTDLATWRYDDISDQVSRYADPSLTFDREEIEYDGKRFLVLRVHEFDDVPVLCKRDYQVTGTMGKPVLRAGACYVRSRRKPETSEIPTHEDMRALLGLAVQKGLRDYFALSAAGGIDISAIFGQGDVRRFEAERLDLVGDRASKDGLIAEIRSRGHWEVVIRPTKYVADRVADFAELLPLVETNRVSARGWSFPYVDHGDDRRRGADWVGQETAYGHYLEAWRLYRSGQFVHLAGIWTDWHDRPGNWVPVHIRGRPVLPVCDTVGRFTEIFEFAARLALSRAGDESMRVDVRLVGLAGRQVYADNPSRHLFRAYIASPNFEEFRMDQIEVTRTELSTSARDRAVEAARQLFLRFGLDLTPELLREVQQEVVPGQRRP